MKHEFPFLIFASAVSLIIGAASLRLGNLAPLSLTYLTAVAISILVVYALYLLRTRSRRYTFVGVILAIVSFAVSTNSAHLRGLSVLFTSQFTYLTVADITMILGFYLFPAVYIIFWVVRTYQNKSSKRDTESTLS